MVLRTIKEHASTFLFSWEIELAAIGGKEYSLDVLFSKVKLKAFEQLKKVFVCSLNRFAFFFFPFLIYFKLMCFSIC